MQKYIITVYGSLPSENVLLTTVKSRYDSEENLVSSLALNILNAEVRTISFRHESDNETHVHLHLASDDADAARLLVYGSGFARDDRQ